MTPEDRCARKAAYLSEKCAENAAFLINLRNLTQEGRHTIQVPDQCPVCADWHLIPDTTFTVSQVA